MGLLSRTIRRACVAVAARLPKRAIAVDADDVYLERYYIFGASPRYFPEHCRRCNHAFPSTVGLDGWRVCAKGGMCEPEPVRARLSFLPTVYLHHFLRSDADVELHDHPFNGVSLILAGGYLEERRVPGSVSRGAVLDHDAKAWTVARRVCRPFSVNRIMATDFHRVDLIEHDAWTIFATGQKLKSWGFWDRFTGTYRDYREHLRHRRANGAAA